MRPLNQDEFDASVSNKCSFGLRDEYKSWSSSSSRFLKNCSKINTIQTTKCIQIHFLYFFLCNDMRMLTALDYLTHKPSRSSPHPASPEETQIREESVMELEVFNDFDLSSAPWKPVLPHTSLESSKQNYIKSKTKRMRLRFEISSKLSSG